MSVQRILLAVGMESLENALTNELATDPNYQFISDPVLYREAVESKVIDENPEILIIREGLRGGIGIKKLLKNLRLIYNGRIVLIAEDHGKDTINFLKGIFNLGIYDIVWGGEIDIAEIIQHIRTPATFSETMTKLGLDRMDEDDEGFDSDYVSARIVQKQSNESGHKQSVEKVITKQKREESQPESQQHSLSTVKKRQEVIEGEVVESADNVHLTESLHPEIQRSSEISSESESSKDTTAASPKQAPVSPPWQSASPKAPLDPPAEILKTPAPEQRLQSSPQPKTKQMKETEKPERSRQSKQNQPTNILTKKDLEESQGSYLLPLIVTTPRQVRKKQMMRKQQSVMFLGSRDGVGCTTIAFNTALMLAAEGHRVIYIDFREEIPSQIVRLDISPKPCEGLDTFILNYKENIVYLDQCKIRLKKPELASLDILGFSTEFVSKGQFYNWQKTFARTVKEVQPLYDYVICDAMLTQTNKSALLQLAKAVDKVAVVTTQDSFIGTTTLWLTQWLSSNGLVLDEHVCLIVNQFENVFPGESDMQKIFKIKSVFRIPEDRKGMLYADSQGLPYMFGPKRAKTRMYFQKIRDWTIQ